MLPRTRPNWSLGPRPRRVSALSSRILMASLASFACSVEASRPDKTNAALPGGERPMLWFQVLDRRLVRG